MRAAAACLAAVLLAPPAVMAHHSLAVYDDGQVLEISGEVAQFEWVNPHIRIHVVAGDGTEAVTFEGGDIGRLTRLGWREDAFHAGDAVTVSYNPFRSGAPGGHFLEITDAKGEIYSLVRFRRAGTEAAP
jgi:hypothetical protein